MRCALLLIRTVFLAFQKYTYNYTVLFSTDVLVSILNPRLHGRITDQNEKSSERYFLIGASATKCWEKSNNVRVLVQSKWYPHPKVRKSQEISGMGRIKIILIKGQKNVGPYRVKVITT